MQTNCQEVKAFVVRPENLTSLDNNVLIDLLAHKTRLLLAAVATRLPDRNYIQQLNSEVEALQAETKRRMES